MVFSQKKNSHNSQNTVVCAICRPLQPNPPNWCTCRVFQPLASQLRHLAGRSGHLAFLSEIPGSTSLSAFLAGAVPSCDLHGPSPACTGLCCVLWSDRRLTALAYTLCVMSFWSCTSQSLVASTEADTRVPAAAACAVHLLQATFFVTCVGLIAGLITPAHLHYEAPLELYTLRHGCQCPKPTQFRWGGSNAPSASIPPSPTATDGSCLTHSTYGDTANSTGALGRRLVASL